MCKVKLDVGWCNLPRVASKGGLELFFEYDRILRHDIALLASDPFQVANAASRKRPCGKAERREEIENSPFFLYTVNSLTPFSSNKIIKLPKYSIFDRSSLVHVIHLRHFIPLILCLGCMPITIFCVTSSLFECQEGTSDFRLRDIEHRTS